MINKYQVIYAGANLLAPSSGVLLVYALGAGTIKTVRVKVKTANGAGATVFNVSKNGTDQFTTELTIPSGQTEISVTGLSIAVSFGDILILKLVSISTGGVVAPVALQFESEETVSFGTDLDAIAALTPSNDDILQRKAGAWTNRTIAQIKTDLGLSGTNSGNETASSVGAIVNGASAATPNDTDLVATVESSVVKKITWTNVKAFLKTYFDTLYQTILPSQTGNSGKYLKTDGSSLSWDTPSGGGGSYDGGRPSDSTLSNYYFREDFEGGNALSGTRAARWNLFGSTVPVHISGIANHPGLIQIVNSTSTPIGIALHPNDSGILHFAPAAMFDLNWIFRPNTVDSNTLIRVGIGTNPTATPLTDGIYLEKLAADTQFFGVTRAASSQTRTAALATVNASTWYRIRIRRIDASTIGFTLNGGTEVTATATVPTAVLTPFVYITSASGSKTLDVDYFDISFSGLTRY